VAAAAVTLPDRRPGVVLADTIPGTWARDLALVVAGALLTVRGAQISIHVPPSPVPVTEQTLGVVVAGAALGWKRGATSQLLYLVPGLFLPVHATRRASTSSGATRSTTASRCSSWTDSQASRGPAIMMCAGRAVRSVGRRGSSSGT
jgi:hypothetical protein